MPSEIEHATCRGHLILPSGILPMVILPTEKSWMHKIVCQLLFSVIQMRQKSVKFSIKEQNIQITSSDNIMLFDNKMLSDNMLSENMLSDNRMIRADKIMLSDNIVSPYLTTCYHIFFLKTCTPPMRQIFSTFVSFCLPNIYYRLKEYTICAVILL
jgi:hypothetical protein